ncbi:FHA domain-containing protein [Actinomadura spongiicola]|uniref:FHA domain-containing protein n=2 Tax=Actinomadura spongiicola TaxID=2303421 RepID=A0A372GH95_9ACTN|nr:FHA domain-containing protein [Actinomadura spongiicola]
MATLNCPVCDEPFQQGDLLCMSCGANLARAGGAQRPGPGGYDDQHRGFPPPGQPQGGQPQYGAPPGQPGGQPYQQAPDPYQQQGPQHQGPPQPQGPPGQAPDPWGQPPQQQQQDGWGSPMPQQQAPDQYGQGQPQHGQGQHGQGQHGQGQHGQPYGQPQQQGGQGPMQQPDPWGMPQQQDQWGAPQQQQQYSPPDQQFPPQDQQFPQQDQYSPQQDQQYSPQQDQWGAPQPQPQDQWGSPQQGPPGGDQFGQPPQHGGPPQPLGGQQLGGQQLGGQQLGGPQHGGQPPVPPHGREATLLPPDHNQGRQPDSTAFMCPYCEAVLSNPGAAQCDSCLRPLPQKGTPVLRVMFPTGELKVSVGQHLVIGRDAGQSPVASTFTQYDNVSRRHSTVWLDPSGTAWVRDEGSTNGTFVNGERLPRGVEAPLRDGDQLRLAADVTGTVQLT